jgi:hypothetical protein
MTKLSDTQRVILSAAAQHEMGLARVPKTLPAAARNAVFRSLIKNNLLTEINAPREHVGLSWRQDVDGTWIVARITDDGLRAIGIDPNEGDAVAGDDCSGIEGSVPDTAPTAEEPAPQGEDAPAREAAQAAPLTEEIAMLDQALAARAATPRASLRDAAAAILAAWDDQAPRRTRHDQRRSDAPMEALRASCSPASRPARRAMPARRASRARAPSRSRCWPCCGAPRAPRSRRSPRRRDGHSTRSAASSPG